MSETRFLRQVRIADIHHDDAGEAPHDHQQPDGDTEIAVNQKEKTGHRADGVRCIMVSPMPPGIRLLLRR
jgi:hypothetical protein